MRIIAGEILARHRLLRLIIFEFATDNLGSDAAGAITLTASSFVIMPIVATTMAMVAPAAAMAVTELVVGTIPRTAASAIRENATRYFCCAFVRTPLNNRNAIPVAVPLAELQQSPICGPQVAVVLNDRNIIMLPPSCVDHRKMRSYTIGVNRRKCAR